MITRLKALTIGRKMARMSNRLAHRFTVKDYYLMGEQGVFQPGERVELIDGEVIDMMPIGVGHSAPLDGLTQYFGGLANNRWIVRVQSPLRLDENSEPQPDLLLLQGPWQRYKEAHPGPADVFLLIEVADTSLLYDRQTKLPLYARSGIPEVWILNVSQRQLEVYRQPGPHGYASTETHRSGMVAPAAFPDALVDVGELVS